MVKILFITCPCSAALSRQLLQQAFLDDFSEQETIDKSVIEAWLRSDKGSVATPHSQRSYANVLVKLDDTYTGGFPISELIGLAEDTLKRPCRRQLNVRMNKNSHD